MTDDKAINAAAREAAAKAIWSAEPERIGSRRRSVWEEESEDTRNRYRPLARAAIDEADKVRAEGFDFAQHARLIWKGETAYAEDALRRAFAAGLARGGADLEQAKHEAAIARLNEQEGVKAVAALEGISSMTDPHEDLVEAVARKLVYEYEISDGFNDFQARRASEGDMWRNFRAPARAVIALIAERTKDATPEILDAWDKAPLPTSNQTAAIVCWRAMHRASALWPKEKA